MKTVRPVRRIWLTAGVAWLAAPLWAQTPANTPSQATASTPAQPPTEVRAALAQASLQGQGRLRFLGLRVYEARLWVPAGQSVKSETLPEQALALEIRYQRALEGGQIAERSLAEMSRQGELDSATAQRWLTAMKSLFPDVTDGSRITGVHVPRRGARFYVDGRLKGEVNEPEFARRFFGIWLAPQSSDLRLRAALLGQDAAVP